MHLTRTLLITLLLSCLGGCALVKLQGDAKTFYSSTVLVGRVTSEVNWDKPIVVAAFAKGDQKVAAHYTVLHAAGGYELLVPKGEYRILAFGDSNGNLTLDAGEPVGQFKAGPVIASGSGTVVELNFYIGDQKKTDFAVGTAVTNTVPARLHSTQVGAIADLDAPIFSAKSGQGGYWAPTEFFRAAGGNIYFLDKYDPAKIPVLFVHGVGGSPQDWRYFFDHLDRTRFQPWFFYYPSGASLDSISYLLFWKLMNLQRDHHFDKLYFTAHSMGGLVVRNFLANHGAQLPAEKMFISLSTPWGGDTMADLGVEYSPAVVPSWNDMQANGRFIQTLFQRPLPNDMDYYLFFGHAGKYSVLRSSNTDGAITLASELRPAAQAEARMVYGFNENHTGILRSPQVFARYAALLDAAASKTANAKAPRGGQIRLGFSFDAPSGVSPVEPWMVLTPADPAQERIVVPISARDSGNLLGPFPPGSYEVSLISYGFKSEPARATVVVRAGESPEARFNFKPIGMVSGYIGADVKASDNPAGSFREPHRNISIESITLSNGGVVKTLIPDAGTTDRTLDSYVAGEDYASQSAFFFGGLADGDYELTINAKGYRPYRQMRRVANGQFGQVEPIVLTQIQR